MNRLDAKLAFHARCTAAAMMSTKPREAIAALPRILEDGYRDIDALCDEAENPAAVQPPPGRIWDGVRWIDDPTYPRNETPAANGSRLEYGEPLPKVTTENLYGRGQPHVDIVEIPNAEYDTPVCDCGKGAAEPIMHGYFCPTYLAAVTAHNAAPADPRFLRLPDGHPFG